MKRTAFCYSFIRTCLLLLSGCYHCFPALQSSFRLMHRLWLPSQGSCKPVYLKFTPTPLSILGGRIKSLSTSHMLSSFHQQLLHSRSTKNLIRASHDLLLSESKLCQQVPMSLLSSKFFTGRKHVSVGIETAKARAVNPMSDSYIWFSLRALSLSFTDFLLSPKSKETKKLSMAVLRPKRRVKRSPCVRGDKKIYDEHLVLIQTLKNSMYSSYDQPGVSRAAYKLGSSP